MLFSPSSPALMVRFCGSSCSLPLSCIHVLSFALLFNGGFLKITKLAFLLYPFVIVCKFLHTFKSDSAIFSFEFGLFFFPGLHNLFRFTTEVYQRNFMGIVLS